MTNRHPLWPLVVAATACAPPSTLPAPVSTGAAHEAGVALHGGVGFSPAGGLDHLSSTGNANLTAYYERWMGARLVVGAQGTGGFNLGSAGVFARYTFLERGPWAVGVAANAGLVYALASLPVSFQVREDLWVWTQPQGGFSLDGPLRLPLGVSYRSSTNPWGADLEAGLKQLGYWTEDGGIYGAFAINRRW